MEVKARHIKMKGTHFNSEINYRYNILLRKVAGSLTVGFLKIILFLGNLLLWSTCSWALSGQNPTPCIMLEGKPDARFPLARYVSVKRSLQCCGWWGPFPTHPFCKATLLIWGTNTTLQEDGRERGGLHARGCSLSKWRCERAAAML